MSDYRILAALGRLSRAGVLTYALPSAARTANGDSGALDATGAEALALDFQVTAVAGTGPSLTVFVDRQDANGTWRQIYASAAVTAAGTTTAHIGRGLPVNVALTDTLRLRWTVAASVTFAASLVGR